jgi:hypothetical protein
MEGIEPGPFFVEAVFADSWKKGTPSSRIDRYRFPDQVLFDPGPIKRFAFAPKGSIVKNVGIPPSCVPSISSSGTDPALYDNFDDPTFEYFGPNPCKWIYAGPPSCPLAIQAGGALQIADQCKSASFVYETFKKWQKDQFDFFEIQFKIKSPATDGNGLLQIKINADLAGSNWTNGCDISTSTAPYVQVNCGTQSRKLAQDTWHTMKIEINQVRGIVNQFLNGEKMGEYLDPLNIKRLGNFKPAIGIIHSGGQKLEGVYIRGIRIE